MTQNAFRRERPPYAFACEMDSPRCPVKDPAGNLHTDSPLLVPPCAFNATTTSLGLGTHALT